MATQQIHPWNKDRIIGQKRPLQISHIWGIRIRLELEGKMRDLALFNLGLDSKLRGCDLVKLKVSDVACGRSLLSRTHVVQQKTGCSVRNHPSYSRLLIGLDQTSKFIRVRLPF